MCRFHWLHSGRSGLTHKHRRPADCAASKSAPYCGVKKISDSSSSVPALSATSLSKSAQAPGSESILLSVVPGESQIASIHDHVSWEFQSLHGKCACDYSEFHLCRQAVSKWL